MRAARADLAALESVGTRTLRVGSTQDVTARIVPTLLRSFARVRPDVVVTIDEGDSAEALAQLVARGDVDLAFVEVPLPPERLDGVALFSDPYVVVVQAGSPLARRGRPIAPATIGELPLVAHTPTRAIVEDHLRSHGVEPRFVLQSEASATVQALVAAGLGAAIVPRLAVDESLAETVLLPLEPPHAIAARVVTLAWNAGRPPRKEAAAFIETARVVALELGLARGRGGDDRRSSRLCA
jgi:DNA-binding transcriptional LysR family regulator